MQDIGVEAVYAVQGSATRLGMLTREGLQVPSPPPTHPTTGMHRDIISAAASLEILNTAGPGVNGLGWASSAAVTALTLPVGAAIGDGGGRITTPARYFVDNLPLSPSE